MSRFKPWPHGTYEPYREILRLMNILEAMTFTCLEEGIKGKNKELVKRIIKLIYMRAREIQEAAKEITALLPDERGGRYPKWFTATMDISGHAMSIVDLSQEVMQSLKANEFIYIESLLKCIDGQVENIKALLDSVPEPEVEVPKVWEEAFNDRSER